MKKLSCFVFLFILQFLTYQIFAQSKANEIPLESIRISGKTLAVINDGDYVYPALSPDGSQIAYSRVIVQKKTELTEIAVRNLKTNRTIILLTPQLSKKYATYAAFASHLEWLDGNKLLAVISDGDVDSTKLTFNVRTRRVVKTEYSGDEDFPDSFVQSELKLAVKTIQEIAPQLPEDVINEALQDGNGAFAVEKRGVVFQHHYAGYDDHIHFFDFQNKTRKTLLEINDSFQRLPRLLGGFALNGKIIFALESRTSVRIFEHQNNKTKLLAEYQPKGFKGNMFGFVVKYRTPEKILFMLQPNSTISDVRGSLWVYDSSGLKKTSDQNELLDVDIKSNLIAFNYWTGGRRYISIKKFDF